MKATLEDIRNKLLERAYKNEEQVRLSLVARLLAQLGWDIWNPGEVNSEFIAVPNEDSTRVDLALFLGAYVPPAVYIEVKAVGKLQGEIGQLEIQLRNYNRNNTALFSVITDGQRWRFYYSQTGGEFSKKCFKTLDLVTDDLDELESVFRTFLSKSEMQAGSPKYTAEKYLQFSQKQRAMEDVMSQARRMILEPPYPRLPEALIQLVAKTGLSVTTEEADRFIEELNKQKPFPDVPLRSTVTSPEALGLKALPAKEVSSSKDRAGLCRRNLMVELQEQGIKLVPLKGVIHKTERGGLVGIAFASEQGPRAETWFLGLPVQEYEAAVLICEQANGEVLRFVLPGEFLQKYKGNFSQSKGQFKFHIAAEGKAYYIKIPSIPMIPINQYLNSFASLKAISR